MFCKGIEIAKDVEKTVNGSIAIIVDLNEWQLRRTLKIKNIQIKCSALRNIPFPAQCFNSG